MRTRSLDFVLFLRCAASLAIPRRASSRSSGAQKTVCGSCGACGFSWYDRTRRRVRDLSAGDQRVYLDVEIRRIECPTCSSVKRERLDFLADNPHYTKRFVYAVGRRCRSATIKDVAEELHLDWDSVKELDKPYMRAQLAKVGTPGPKAIGIDEISIGKGQNYRIVVSDLIRRRAIWFGGTDRKEASMAAFYQWLGPRETKRIRLAVMDMWKPFRNVTQACAPQAAILFDKFHIMSHLSDALDDVRKAEYARLSGKERRYIKGQKYTLQGEFVLPIITVLSNELTYKAGHREGSPV